jgi:hypothetical protein
MIAHALLAVARSAGREKEATRPPGTAHPVDRPRTSATGLHASPCTPTE